MRVRYRYYDRKKSSSCLPGGCTIYYDRKKKVLVICLASAQLPLFYDWLTTYKFVCDNSHVSICSINDGALFGGRREKTREDANKIGICMIDRPHTNSYVVTHMYQFVASTTAPFWTSSSTSLAKGSYLLIWRLKRGSEMKYEFVWLIDDNEFVCGNSHVSILSINNGTLFGGRREETHEDANKIWICMIDWLHTNSYVVTHMYQFVASTKAPYLDFFINITCQRFLPSYLEAEARKWDEIPIRMIDWPHTN